MYKTREQIMELNIPQVNKLKLLEQVSEHNQFMPPQVYQSSQDGQIIDSYNFIGGQDQKQKQQDDLKKEIKDLMIRRNDLQIYMHKPQFDQIVEGLFVRLKTSIDKQYELGQIIGVEQSKKSYQLGSSITSLQLRVQNGKDSKLWDMRFVSNDSNYIQSQWTNWLMKNKLKDQPLTIQQVRRRKEKRLSTSKQESKTEQINDMIQKKIDKILMAQNGRPQQIKAHIQFLNNQRHSLQVSQFSQQITRLEQSQQKKLTQLKDKTDKLKIILQNTIKDNAPLKQSYQSKIIETKRQIAPQIKLIKGKQIGKYSRTEQVIRQLATRQGAIQLDKKLFQLHSSYQIQFPFLQ